MTSNEINLIADEVTLRLKPMGTNYWLLALTSIITASVAALIQFFVQRFTEQNKTKFSWLYEKNATVMIEIHQEVLNVIRAFNELDDENIGDTEKLIAAEDAIHAYVKACTINQILFSEKMVDNFRQTSTAYEQIINLQRKLMNEQSEEIIRDLRKKRDTAAEKTNKMNKLLRKNFRRIYGV